MSRIKHTFSFTVGSTVPAKALEQLFEHTEALRGADIKYVKSEEVPEPIKVGTKVKFSQGATWYYTVRAYDAEYDKCLVVSSSGGWSWAHGSDVRTGVKVNE